MEHAILLPKTCSLFKDESEEKVLQTLLDRLSQKKISWDAFERQIDDPLAVSRLASSYDSRTVLHLAVLDERIEWVELLKNESHLKSRRDEFGLSPIDLANLLDRKEAMEILQPIADNPQIPEWPKIDSFEYLLSPIFESREGLEEVLTTVAKTKKEDRIPSEKIWMGIYFDKEIRKAMHPPIEIRFVDKDVGYGVFATKKIPPCTFVGEYTGIIQQRTPKQLKEKKYCLRYTIWEGKKNFCIDAETKGNFTRFLNHSSKPNLGLQSLYWRGIPRMVFLSLKEIREGEQLAFDYGPLFWKHHPESPKEWSDDF
ncbi:MAG: SET domain-containing protein-lysine N-methyltransferase [Parachlamydiales bacterium]|nr:SET domain-containing protein-lysine N-methyltransferase [Parachlamydiales bacterium]